MATVYRSGKFTANYTEPSGKKKIIEALAVVPPIAPGLATTALEGCLKERFDQVHVQVGEGSEGRPIIVQGTVFVISASGNPGNIDDPVVKIDRAVERLASVAHVAASNEARIVKSPYFKMDLLAPGLQPYRT